MKIHAIIIAVTLIVVGTHAATLQTAQGTRKVLTRLALADDLSEALNNAQNSLSNDVMKAAKLNRMNYASEDLQLVDVFFHINTDTTVELTNVKLSNGPEVVITSAKPNLEFLNMAVDFSLGSLEVTGTYEIVSKSVLSVLPATSNGEFTLTLSNVGATGKVGLSLIEDSFSTINYDIKYVPESQFLRTRYQTLDGSILSSISPDVQDIIISEKISRELQNLLNQIVKKQLDNVLCEMSVDELIGDTKMTVTYRAHAREVRAVANEYVDEVLRYVQEYIVQNHVEEIAIPDVEVGFSRKVLWIRWHGEFYTSNGHVRSLASLQRTADVSLEFDNATGGITVFGALGLGELQVGYDKYAAKFMGIGPSGSLGASVGQNSLFIKVHIVLATQPEIGLEDLHIEYAKDINIDITGLGLLDWLVSNILTWTVGLFNDQIVGSMDGLLHDYVSNVLPNVDPNKYFS